MSDLRLVARAALALAVLALLAGAVALHALRIERDAGSARARALAEARRAVAWDATGHPAR